MRLLVNWRDSWKWFSTQALLAIGALNGVAVAAIPFTPHAMKVVAGTSLAAAIVGAVGRVIDQGPREIPPEPMEHEP